MHREQDNRMIRLEGFGLSDWADCLAGLLDSTGIERAHILGLSWGGILAQEFYHRHPRRVLSLVLADTYAGWKGSLQKKALDERVNSIIHDASLQPKDFVSKYLPTMFGDSPKEEVKENFGNIMSDFHPAGFRILATDLANIDTRKILPTIEAPTQLIWGKEDKRSPLDIAYQFRNDIPNAKLELIPHAGHVSNLEAPTQFNKIVKDFCLPLSDK